MNEHTLKTEKILGERIHALVEDGYLLKVIYWSPTSKFTKLVHRSNGNVITINANIMTDHMVQKTNGKVTYTGKITA